MSVERALKALLLLADLGLLLALGIAWGQAPLAAHWDLPSPLRLHVATAILALLLAFFAHLFIIFYFVGTGLWIKEQARAQHGRERMQKLWAHYQSANRLKGRAFPFPTLVIVSGIFSFVLGGARHVGALPAWLHPALACVCTLCAFVGIRVIFNAMNENVEILDRVSEEIDAHRVSE